MARLKLYRTYPAIELPSAWARVVNPRDFHGQGHVLVIALNKASAVKNLIWYGLHDREAARIMRKTHVVNGDRIDNELEVILSSAVVDTSKPGVYTWRNTLNRFPLARVTAAELLIVGTFERPADHNAKLTVRPTGTENPNAE